MISVCRYDSPLGEITLAGEGEALTGLWFDGQKYFPQGLPRGGGNAARVGGSGAVAGYLFFGQGSGGCAAVAFGNASPFRRRVWELLRGIPYGQLTTYGKLAALLERETGRAVSARAVGGAVGHNPVSLIIPCHRVVGADGDITGYAGGVGRKIALLELKARCRAGRLKKPKKLHRGGTAFLYRHYTGDHPPRTRERYSSSVSPGGISHRYSFTSRRLSSYFSPSSCFR